MSSAATLRADAAHIPLVLDMMEDFNAGEEIPWDRGAVEASLRRLLADAALGFVVVAVTARGLEGYAVVTFNYDLEFRGRDAFVTELYVRPAARGAGLGRLLLASAEAMAVAEDARALHLLVRPDNTRAIALYRASGFVQTPRVMMTKDLAAAAPRSDG
ncbi:GNAT family N-acetyltransferase [Sorangium sp. So ce385]|uniref:GNAT family N-acetyltransferase n=1 Tax=Sorangium sp. So ce385 TaxID=3133308 RepID=UPI003F5B1053